MPSPSTFVPVSGGMIRDLRKAMNYSQATLASKVGVSKATIVNIERGVTEQMREPNALKLAEALGVGVKKITGVKEVAKTSDAFEALGLSAGEQTRLIASLFKASLTRMGPIRRSRTSGTT